MDKGIISRRLDGREETAGVTIVIPEMIELLELKPGDYLRDHLEATLNAQCAALSRLQDESGLWHTLLDHNDDGSYLEASATAGFAFGMLKGARKRYLGAAYKTEAEKAVKAVMGAIDEQGELQHTSFGTGVGHDLDYYRKVAVTAMPYGQAMAMMALVEYLRIYI